MISKVGTIGSLPEVDKEGKPYYEVQIPVASRILTDHDKEIPYKPNMSAQVEIITEGCDENDGCGILISVMIDLFLGEIGKVFLKSGRISYN